MINPDERDRERWVSTVMNLHGSQHLVVRQVAAWLVDSEGCSDQHAAQHCHWPQTLRQPSSRQRRCSHLPQRDVGRPLEPPGCRRVAHPIGTRQPSCRLRNHGDQVLHAEAAAYHTGMGEQNMQPPLRAVVDQGSIAAAHHRRPLCPNLRQHNRGTAAGKSRWLISAGEPDEEPLAQYVAERC